MDMEYKEAKVILDRIIKKNKNYNVCSACGKNFESEGNYDYCPLCLIKQINNMIKQKKV